MIVRLLRILRLILIWPGYRLRGNHFSIVKTSIGQRTYLRRSEIGRYAFIGRDCVINNSIIGNYTCIADGVQIGGMEHPYWDYSISPQLSNQYVFGKQTIIGPDVWIAAGSIIKQGVKIGTGAVIGANSFVTKDVPDYAIVFGTPAKVYKYRFGDDIIKKLIDSSYFEFKPKEAKAILESLKEGANE